jgi:hypothetical protein
MHGRRALAAAAAAALLISPFAPWYRETIVARGLTGLRTMSVAQSGWQAFGFTGAVVLIVAVVALVLMAAVPVTAERAGQGVRLSGALVTVLGAIAFVVVLARLATAAGTTHHALAVTTVSTRWGIYLALGASALLTVASVRLLRAPQPDRPPDPGPAARRDPAARPNRTPRATGPPRSTRRPDRAANRTKRATRSDPEASPAAVRRAERQRPARRSDRPRWEDGSTSWLDAPD